MVTPSRPVLRLSNASNQFSTHSSPAETAPASQQITSKRARKEEIPIRGLPSFKKQTTLDAHFARWKSQPAIPNSSSEPALSTPSTSQVEELTPTADVNIDGINTHSTVTTSIPPPASSSIVRTRAHGVAADSDNAEQDKVVAESKAQLSDSHAATVAPSTVNTADPSTKTPAKSDKRVTRSKDVGPRHKSELSKFFADFEDVMSDVPKLPELLQLDQPILLVNEPLKQNKTPTKAESSGSTIQTPTRIAKQDAGGPQDAKPPSQITPKRIDIPPVTMPKIDPLSDDYYFKAHRRKENAEKRLRNIEKENALHDKAHLEKVFEELTGPDWLRCMGVGAVSDAEKKALEPKRAHFIRETRLLLNKFQRWKDEEKRMKMEKAAREAESSDEEESEDEEASTEESSTSRSLDAAAQQLLDEATGKKRPSIINSKQRIRLKINMPKARGTKATNESLSASSSKKPAVPAPPPSPTPEPSEPESEDLEDQSQTVVFFDDVALPRFRTREFNLPQGWITEEALRANARKRRKLNRELQQARREEDEKKAKG